MLLSAIGWPLSRAWAQPLHVLPPPGLLAASWPLLGLLALTAFSSTLAAGLGAAALVRRGVVQPLAAALADIEAAGERLASIAAHAGNTLDEIDTVTKAARAAARDTASGVVGLAECQTRQRSWLASAEAEQGRIRALADQCERLTEVMPALLGSAVDQMQSRGLAGLDDGAMRLRRNAESIEDAAAALHTKLAGWQEEAASQTGQHSAELSRQIALLAELREELRTPNEAPDIAAELGAIAARLDQGAGRIDGAVGVLETGIGALAQAAGEHAALRAGAAGLAALYERLARDLPAQAAEALGAIEAQAHTVLGRIDGRCADHAARIGGSIEAAGAALRGIANLHDTAERQAQAAGAAGVERIKALDACLQRAVSLGEALPGIVASLSDAAEAWPPAVSALTEIGARGEVALAAAGKALGALEDHAAAAGPREAALAAAVLDTISAASAPCAAAGEALAQQAAAMSQIACRLEAAQAEHAARLDALVAVPVAGLEALCQHAAETLAGVNGLCMRLEPVLEPAWAAFQENADRAGRTEAALQAMLTLVPKFGESCGERCGEHLAAADAASARLAVLGDRLASVLDANEASACRLAIAAEAAGAASLRTAEAPFPSIEADAVLSGLYRRVEQVGDAAAALQARAELQEAAALRVADAALRVAQAAGPAGPAVAADGVPAPMAAALADQAGRTETILQAVMTLLPDCRDGLAAADMVAARLTAQLTAQGDRLAGLLSAHEDAAARLWEAEAAAKAAHAASVEGQAAPPMAEAMMAELSGRIAQVSRAASRLEAHAALQEDAALRVAQAALSVAQATAPAQVTEPDITAALHAVGDHVAQLQAAARKAAHGQHAGLDTAGPAMLTEIDQNIRRLQGAATAVALACDIAGPPKASRGAGGGSPATLPLKAAHPGEARIG